MKMKTVLQGMVYSLLLILCSNTANGQLLKDIDGNEYKVISYGLQDWISGNLKVTHFRNGDSIPEARTKEEWVNAGMAGQPVWCYFDNNPENDKQYGKLYNWYAISDPRGLAPEGWHVSVNSDWSKLVKNLLGIDYAGPKLKHTTGWKTKNGTDKIKFGALPGGYRDDAGVFSELKTRAQWWSNSEPVEVKKSNQIYSLVLSDTNESVMFIKTNKESGLSVRCLKD